VNTWRILIGSVLVATFAGVFLWDSVLTSDSANAPVTKSWVLPAEWEPHEAIWMGFRSREEAYDSVTLPMLRASRDTLTFVSLSRPTA
jgi:hypothetical protein